jgi:hypothetical protein
VYKDKKYKNQILTKSNQEKIETILLPVNIMSGFVANKLSGLCHSERRKHEPDKMATGNETNAI